MKGRVFVVMPFRDETEDLWELGIRQAAEALGWECYRADKIASQDFLVAKIYDEISKADVVVGEMTGQNPNVFYEIGFAHALGKPTLLLARSAEDLTAFDTRGFQHGLHASRIPNVSRIVSNFLSSIDLGDIYPPTPPGAKILYEWPSPSFEVPIFAWTPKNKEGCVDEFGGQAVEPAPPAGPIIRVRRTNHNWNWKRGGSIMRLVRTQEIEREDIVYLNLTFRAIEPVVFGFIGDGGNAAVPGQVKPEWSRSWKDIEFKVTPAPKWQSKTIRVVVEPRVPSYDPRERTTVLLTTRTGDGAAEIRKIRVLLCKAPNQRLQRTAVAAR